MGEKAIPEPENTPVDVLVCPGYKEVEVVLVKEEVEVQVVTEVEEEVSPMMIADDNSIVILEKPVPEPENIPVDKDVEVIEVNEEADVKVGVKEDVKKEVKDEVIAEDNSIVILEKPAPGPENFPVDESIV